MKNNICSLVFMIFILAAVYFANADDSYRLWLKYDLISDQDLLRDYRERIKAIMFEGESGSITVTAKSPGLKEAQVVIKVNN